MQVHCTNNTKNDNKLPKMFAKSGGKNPSVSHYLQQELGSDPEIKPGAGDRRPFQLFKSHSTVV